VTSIDRPAFEADVAGALGPDRLARDAPIARMTTFRVGGPADWFVELRTVEEVRATLACAHRHGVPVTVLGGGSNVLVADAGVRGLVVRLVLAGIRQPVSDEVQADAGVTINGMVRWMIGRGLAALEAWAGTPGTVGGAIYGNAHWSGQNIGDVVRRVLLATPDGTLIEVPASAMGFAYDTSRLQTTREVVVHADFAVAPGEVDALRARARASLAYRKRTQPLALPSAGCMFQNPDPARDRVPAGIPPSAGALIDRAGLKGRRIGGACISPVHANFIVNDAQATASDIRALVETARTAVEKTFGVALRDEVVYLGTFEHG